jgi:hypothetical protein
MPWEPRRRHVGRTASVILAVVRARVYREHAMVLWPRRNRLDQRHGWGPAMLLFERMISSFRMPGVDKNCRRSMRVYNSSSSQSSRLGHSAPATRPGHSAPQSREGLAAPPSWGVGLVDVTHDLDIPVVRGVLASHHVPDHDMTKNIEPVLRRVDL